MRDASHDGPESRTLLIETAMELFAQRGIEATSIRSINRAAGLAAAAVHYHFGSKDALLNAVVSFHAGDVLGAISAACDELLTDGCAPRPRQLIDTFASPYRSLLVEAPRSGRHWLAVIAQLVAGDDARIDTFATAGTSKLEAVAEATFPAADIERIRLALRIAVITFIQMMVQQPRENPPVDAHAEALTEFVTGGLIAVLGDASLREPTTAAA